MVHIHWTHYVEVGVLELQCAILLPLIIAQLLAYRFTPPKKRSLVKQRMLYIGSFVWLLQAIRCMDFALAFGMFTVPFQILVGEQATAFIVDAATLLLVASSHALYAILAKPQPPLLPKVYHGIAIVYHILALGVTLVDVTNLNGANPSRRLATDAKFARCIIFGSMCITILIANWYSLWGLRSQIAMFVRTLERFERREQEMSPLSQTRYLSSDGGRSDLPPQSPQVQPVDSSDDVPATHMVYVAPKSPTNGGASPTNVPTVPAPAVSTTSSRLVELRATTSKLNKLHFLTNIILLAGIINNMPFFVDYSHGKLATYVRNPEDPAPYQNDIYPFFQNIAVGVITWYCWLDTSVWRKIASSAPAVLVPGEPPPQTFWSLLRRGAMDVSSPPFTQHLFNQQHQQQQQQHHAAHQQGPTPSHRPHGTTEVLIDMADANSTNPPAVHTARPLVEQLVSKAPIDSAASHAPTGLSMRSGLTSLQAVRAEGDLYDEDTLAARATYGGASTIDHSHLLDGNHPFVVAEGDETLYEKSSNLHVEDQGELDEPRPEPHLQEDAPAV